MPHHYTGQLGGGGASGYALAAADGVPELRTAPPPEFNGPRRLWSPEYLLLAAVETCFLFTLRATAKVSRVEFDSCAVTTKGTVDRVEGVTRFTEQCCVHDRDSGRERALVTASLATPVRIEAELS